MVDEAETMKLSDYIKRLKRKKSKKSKLKPNECPRCGYDGTGRIKDGPNKGKKFPDGFATKILPTGKMSYCQNCQYTEFNDKQVSK
jgi:predicted nucleic-acid-binding Zn-ribbon protein